MKYKKIILLGIDGLDSKILCSLMREKILPNSLQLSERGRFSQLITSTPAQSPVAWASIATGRNPGHHGIFDFLSRRLSDYMPELAITRPNPKNIFGKRENMFLPVMQGNTFWDYLSEHGIPTTVIRWPMTFQPKQNRVKLYAGLGVPDIKGGLGKYTFYTTGALPEDSEGIEKVVRLYLRGDKIKTFIEGPNVTKLTSREPAKVELNIKLIDNEKIELNIDGKRIVLSKHKWSEWVEVRFKLGFMKSVTGTVKFYLCNIKPEFELYMTPVQVNPRDPAFIISSPDSYVRELASELGYFYTLGMPEDTKALEEGRIDEDAFISMCDEIISEQEKMLLHEIERFKEGLFAFVFFSTDRIQHMFWAATDPQHPLYDRSYAERYGRVIENFYMRMDRIVGEVMRYVDDRTALMVFSDHGFTSFRRAVHLNSWLVKNGFMTLTREIKPDDKDCGELFKFVDWQRTYAYSLGFGSIYLNIKGREKNGIVDPEEADSLMNKISAGLLDLKDPEFNVKVIKNVYKSRNIYHGEYVSDAPDLIVGFNDGYRASWQTAIGGSPSRIIENNLKKWSGDHIVDPSLVPGILLTNFPVAEENPHQIDIAPTVFACFEISISDMEGKVLF